MVAQNQDAQVRLEALGPAERIVQALTTFTDHMVHNRPGIVVKDARRKSGVRWEQVTWKDEDGTKVVYKVTKVGKKRTETKVGRLALDGVTVKDDRDQVIGEYRKPGLFPEVAVYLYKQVAEVFKMDNEFAAKWASWQFAKDHRDMKVILTAFMLVQDRRGDPVVEDGEVLFFDDDFRAVGEAMTLITGAGYLDAKLLNRVGDVLALEGVAAINRDLGFGKSARKAPMGRYNKAVTKWLRYRESNPRMLKGLVDKAGLRTNVMRLAKRVHYKPTTSEFFKVLRWKQKQAKDGRRTMAIGEAVSAAESWAELTEREICEKITESKFGAKRIAGLLPNGWTRAIMMASIEAGALSNSDFIIMSPTLEELGLLQVPTVRERWKKANEQATNQRAANIAKNLKAKANQEVMEDTADQAAAKAMEEVTRDLRIMVIVDKSGSMGGALERAKEICKKLLVSFPMDRLHVSVFNSVGTEVTFKAARSAAIEHAFKGHRAGGTTEYGEGVRALAHHRPKDGEDVLVIFVGDQGDRGVGRLVNAIQMTGWNPVAFGMLSVLGPQAWKGTVVEEAAPRLGIPWFNIEPELFDDPYTVTRTLRNLIASTPVGQAGRVQAVHRRRTLLEEILGTPLLTKPNWAA
jgi:hypothetical protein